MKFEKNGKICDRACMDLIILAVVVLAFAQDGGGGHGRRVRGQNFHFSYEDNKKLCGSRSRGHGHRKKGYRTDAVAVAECLSGKY